MWSARTLTVTRQASSSNAKQCPTQKDIPNCTPGVDKCPAMITTTTTTTANTTTTTTTTTVVTGTTTGTSTQTMTANSTMTTSETSTGTTSQTMTVTATTETTVTTTTTTTVVTNTTAPTKTTTTAETTVGREFIDISAIFPVDCATTVNSAANTQIVTATVTESVKRWAMSAISVELFIQNAKVACGSLVVSMQVAGANLPEDFAKQFSNAVKDGLITAVIQLESATDGSATANNIGQMVVKATGSTPSFFDAQYSFFVGAVGTKTQQLELARALALELATSMNISAERSTLLGYTLVAVEGQPGLFEIKLNVTYVSTTVSEATEAKIALPKAVAKAKTTTVKINGRVVSNDQVEAAIGAQLITTGTPAATTVAGEAAASDSDGFPVVALVLIIVAIFILILVAAGVVFKQNQQKHNEKLAQMAYESRNGGNVPYGTAIGSEMSETNAHFYPDQAAGGSTGAAAPVGEAWLGPSAADAPASPTHYVPGATSATEDFFVSRAASSSNIRSARV